MTNAYNKDKTGSITFKSNHFFLLVYGAVKTTINDQKVTFHELKSTLKKGYNWLHIWGVMIIFLL